MSVVHLLVSPGAGRHGTADAKATVISRVEAAGHEIVDLTASSAEASLDAARATVADGCERLIAVGGDGMVHIALQAVAGTNTVLGIVPVGTGNDFAGAVGLTGAPVTEMTDRALGSPASVDAIRTDHGWVATVATGGFSVAVNERAERMSFPKGSSRYTLATILEMPHLRHCPLSLTVDGEQHQLDAALFAVANTAYFGGGMAICPDADPGDGLLDVCVAGDIGRIALLRWLPKVYKGTHLRHPKAHTFRGRKIVVESLDVNLRGDGEALGPLPVTLEAVPGAIQLAR